MWCVPKIDDEYIERMEDILDVLEKPKNEQEPVFVLDERPVQLLDSKRANLPASLGKVMRTDYEYVRRGTANIFCITAPKIGTHLTHATSDRKGDKFANAMKKIAQSCPNASTIHIIMDNLNTHTEKSLIKSFGVEEGKDLRQRFTTHFTPKHASWLNPAEIEASLWSRECLGRDRIGSLIDLELRTDSWNKNANQERRKISWNFTADNARKTFGYERFIKHRSEH